MAATLQRIEVAKKAAELINPIAQRIMEKWGMTFAQIQETGKEAEFDREIIRLIKEDPKTNSIFEKSKAYTKDNFGIAWEAFSEDQKNIIALKETKLW